jgi:hypothetical protein
MRRTISWTAVLASLTLALLLVIPSQVGVLAKAGQPGSHSGRSWPPDTTPYHRPAVPQEPFGVLCGQCNLSDPVLSSQANTFDNSEPSIAINPANPNQIVVMAGFGGWPGNAPLFQSTDGGHTWARYRSITVPPGAANVSGCPCDQTVDLGHGNTLYGTFLTAGANVGSIYSGSTTDPTTSAAWNWRTSGTPPVAQKTDLNAVGQATNTDFADQPWLLVNRDPTTASQDDVYVAYDDFGAGSPPINMRVAEATGANPPDFTVDNQSGTGGGSGTNPGHRLAVDPTTGAIYSVFQQATGVNADGSVHINYMLNRSTNGGAAWMLNGQVGGIPVAKADSNQPTPKFGTVNALLGGVDHAAVDPNSGNVYYVYGARDSATGNNRLAIVRLQTDASGNMSVVQSSFVTGQVQAALPSVAVASNGTVGVLYDTFDGFSSNLPMFSAHLAVSTDHAATFNDVVLQTFLSPAPDNGDPRQRVLGDFQQLKALRNTFYGVFSGNRAAPPFNAPMSVIDPIFFKTPAGVPAFAYLASGSFTLGDNTAASALASGATVTWWGANWSTVNSLSGGSAPAAFKGFAKTLSATPPVCGGTWTTTTANRAGPPSSVPSVMAVIASRKISQSGSTISGDIQHIYIVTVNPGYAPDPGHPGTGTVLARLC